MTEVSGRDSRNKIYQKGTLKWPVFLEGERKFWKKRVQNDDDVKQVCLFLGIRIVENPRKVSILLPN